MPMVVIATIALIAGLAIAIAFVALTDDDPVSAGNTARDHRGAMTPAPVSVATGSTPGG